MKKFWFMLARRVFSHPMTHFAILGGCLFALFPPPQNTRAIVISADERRTLLERARKHNAGPIDEEAIIQRYIDEELLYREALRLELDADDRVIRNRLIQKMMFFAEDLAGQGRPPTDENLRAFYDAHPDRWRKNDAYHIEHRFIALKGHRNPKKDAERLRARLLQADAGAPDAQAGSGASVSTGKRSDTQGDPFPLTRAERWMTKDDLAREFGTALADAIPRLEPGSWSEPLRSVYGWHLIRVVEVRPGRRLPFEQVKGRVKTAYLEAGKKQALNKLLTRLRDEYTIVIETSGGSRQPPVAAEWHR